MTTISLAQHYRQIAEEHTRIVTAFFQENASRLEGLTDMVADTISQQSCLFFCGNGGSACDAMHIATTFVGRFSENRRRPRVMALTTNTGILTAVANDNAFDQVFSHQIDAFGTKDDMLLVLSTSGNSPNTLKAIEAAREKGLRTVLFTGKHGTYRSQMVDYCFIVDSTDIGRIQECTLTALHALANGVEKRLRSA